MVKENESKFYERQKVKSERRGLCLSFEQKSTFQKGVNGNGKKKVSSVREIDTVKTCRRTGKRAKEKTKS